MTDKTLADDLREEGYKGNFYYHSLVYVESGKFPDYIYRINDIRISIVGVVVAIDRYDQKGKLFEADCRRNLHDVLRDKRAPQDIVDKIMAKERE